MFEVVDDVVGCCKLVRRPIAISDGTCFHVGSLPHLDIENHVAYDDGVLRLSAYLRKSLESHFWVGLHSTDVVGSHNDRDCLLEAHLLDIGEKRFPAATAGYGYGVTKVVELKDCGDDVGERLDYDGLLILIENGTVGCCTCLCLIGREVRKQGGEALIEPETYGFGAHIGRKDGESILRHCVLECLYDEGLRVGDSTVEIEDYVTNHFLMKTLKEEVEQENIRYCAKGEREQEGAT